MALHHPATRWPFRPDPQRGSRAHETGISQVAATDLLPWERAAVMSARRAGEGRSTAREHHKPERIVGKRWRAGILDTWHVGKQKRLANRRGEPTCRRRQVQHGATRLDHARQPELLEQEDGRSLGAVAGPVETTADE